MMVDIMPRKYRRGDPRGLDDLTGDMKAYDRADEKTRARMIKHAHDEELAEFESRQLDLLDWTERQVFVVVWKRGDILEDQRIFNSERKAERFIADLRPGCSLAHPGSVLLIDRRTPMLPPGPTPAITHGGEHTPGGDHDRIWRHVRKG